MLLGKRRTGKPLTRLASGFSQVSLPYNLEILRFGGNFNQKLPRCLPVALQSLALGYEYQQSFEKVSWSPNLKTLVLGGNYRKLISMDSLLNRLQGVFNFGLSHGCNDQHKHLPQTLESLSLGHDFNESLRQVKLPKGLVSLTLGAKFNQILDADWPSSLQSLTLGHCFNRSLQPCCRITRLQSLTLGELFFFLAGFPSFFFAFSPLFSLSLPCSSFSFPRLPLSLSLAFSLSLSLFLSLSLTPSLPPSLPLPLSLAF